MENFILLCLSFLLFPVLLSAQETCHDINATPTPGATEQFAALGNQKEFQNAHEKPILLTNYVTKGESITYKTPDGQTANAYLVKSAKETPNYLFLIHEWWGLNDNTKREAEEWANKLENTTILALDMYDGKATSDPAEAGLLMKSVTALRGKAIVEGAFIWAGTRAKVATLGWCFGGGWSVQSALIGAKNVVGTVMFYGMPEMDVNKLKTLNADVLAIYGSRDKWITPEVGAKFEKAMNDAGKGIESLYYDADHAFANPSNPKFDKKASKEANEKALAYLKKRLN